MIVYGLIDPFTSQLRYIGKSEHGLLRPRAHRYNIGSGNSGLSKWIMSIIRRNRTYDIWIIQECKTPEELKVAEKEAIATYRFLGCDLLNRSSGGEGFRTRSRVARKTRTTTLPPFREWKRAKEQEYFRKLGEELGWNMQDMADASGLHRSTLYEKMESLQLTDTWADNQ